jgi:hypothetical protein
MISPEGRQFVKKVLNTNIPPSPPFLFLALYNVLKSFITHDMGMAMHLFMRFTEI